MAHNKKQPQKTAAKPALPVNPKPLIELWNYICQVWGRITRRFWVQAVLGVVLAYAGEWLIDSGLKSDSESSQAMALVPSRLYQRIVTFVRAPAVAQTVVVEIDPSREFEALSGQSRCKKRKFLAKLVDRIALAEPSVIVVDKFFPTDACEDEEPASALDKEIRRIRLEPPQKGMERGTPVVVGLQALAGTHLLEPPEQSDFGDKAQAGIYNIPHDPRRLPLSYNIVLKEGEHFVSIDALSLTAARLAREDLLTASPELKRFVEDKEEPFIGFLGAERWKQQRRHFSAGQILCGHEASKGDNWEDCQSINVPQILQHAIVVVGEYSKASDDHLSVVGPVQGYYLHANYIEALLDRQYLAPAGSFWNWTIGIVFLLCYKLVLLFRRGFINSAIRILVPLLILYLFLVAVTLGHTYVDPVIGIVPTFVEVVAVLTEVLAEAVVTLFPQRQVSEATTD